MKPDEPAFSPEVEARARRMYAVTPSGDRYVPWDRLDPEDKMEWLNKADASLHWKGS